VASSTSYEGWGRATWGEGSWGTPLIYIYVDGNSATGSVGGVTVVAEANVDVTAPNAAQGEIGNVDVTADANVLPEGLEAVASVAAVTVKANADVDVSGVAATGAVNAVESVTGTANVYPTGVSADALTPTGGSAFTADGSAQLSTAQAKFGPSSLLLDGTDDFVTSDDNIDLSSGDFTVDMWIRPTNVTGYKGLWQSGTSSLLNVYLIGNQVQGTVAGSTTLFLSSTRISANVWTMISVEREGNVHRLYINGVLEQSSSTANRPDDGVFAVGKNGFGDFNGYIDETRLSTVARYGGTSFTEPTANYAADGDTTALLHFDGTNGSTDIINEADGGVTVEADAVVEIEMDARGNGLVGEVEAQAGADVLPEGLEATGEVGNGTVITINTRVIIDAPDAATGEVSEVSTISDAIVNVLGVEGTGEAGQVLVWGRIVPNQNPSYTPVTPSSTPAWSDDTPSQTPGWDDIAA